MGIFRNVSVGFWTDAKVDDCFSPEEKYLYLYLLTNPHTNICGCYEVSQRQMCQETGYQWEMLDRLITRLQDIHGVIRYSAETKEVLLVNWGKYNWTKSPKVKAAVASVAEYIKDTEFKRFVMDNLEKRISEVRKQKQRAENREQRTEIDSDTENREQRTEIDSDTVSDSDSVGYGMDTVSDGSKPLCSPVSTPSRDEVFSFGESIGYKAEKIEKFLSMCQEKNWEGEESWKLHMQRWKDSEYTSSKPPTRNPEFRPGDHEKQSIAAMRRLHEELAGDN